MRQVQQKGGRVRAGKRGEAYSQTLRQGEVGAAGAQKGYSSGAGAKPRNPICEEAAAFTLGGLQGLELLALFTKHFHVQVAVGFDPVLMNFDRQGFVSTQRC